MTHEYAQQREAMMNAIIQRPLLVGLIAGTVSNGIMHGREYHKVLNKLEADALSNPHFPSMLAKNPHLYTTLRKHKKVHLLIQYAGSVAISPALMVYDVCDFVFGWPSAPPSKMN